MDSILAMGHFCETHGPCVVLCTQKSDQEPVQGPHSLTVPWCEACQSLQLDQALVSREENCCYVTTRTPLQQDLAFLLKHATVRSLSCEQDGTLYFGDNERGHVLSHSFTVHDSLARGFQRKYTILMLMRDKIHLLNLWPSLIKHIKEMARLLKTYSVRVNETEQAQKPQRAVRHAVQGAPGNSGRSLSQLTGKPAIYAHVHLWFAWLLGCQTAVEKSFTSPTTPDIKPSSFLRTLIQDMGQELFSHACSLLLIGVPVKCIDSLIVSSLNSLFPDAAWSRNMDRTRQCIIAKNQNEMWELKTDVVVPVISSFQKEIERSLKDIRLTESALEPHLSSVIIQWLHICRVLSWCPQIDLKLLQSLNVQKNDIQFLTFWTSNCTDSIEKHKSIIKCLNHIFCASK